MDGPTESADAERCARRGQTPPVSASSWVLPAGAGHYDVTDYGAVGDGITDDTQAIRAVFELLSESPHPANGYATIYFPDGVYLVSDQISWERYRIVRGQSTANTIIKLRDAAPGFGAAEQRAVLRARHESADSVGNYIAHLTVDTGRDNPGATGIEYTSMYEGTLGDVLIRSVDGQGRVGLDLSQGNFGPAFIRDVAVDGFEVGIKTPADIAHATLRNIWLQNQTEVGLENHMPLAVQGLTSLNDVVAVRNGELWMSHFVALDAELLCGRGDETAIVSEGPVYLRDVRSHGYGATARQLGTEYADSVIDELVDGEVLSTRPDADAHLQLPTSSPPTPSIDEDTRWEVVDDGAEDDTAAVQASLDSGASTVLFRYGGEYRVTDTMVIPPTVHTIVGMRALLAGDPAVFSDGRPILRISGDGDVPLVVDALTAHAFPESEIVGWEVATSRDVVLRSVEGIGTRIHNAVGATGRLFIEDSPNQLRLEVPQDVWMWQFNPQNNPYDPAAPQQTYLVNGGGRVWVLGWKSESPAVHASTLAGGSTEVLGGFFRDHVASEGIPYFETTDGSVSATYVQYDWMGCGASRRLQALETRDGITAEVQISDCNHAVSLYASHGG